MAYKKLRQFYYKQYLKRSRVWNWNWQRYLIKLFDNFLGRAYLGVPRGKHIYKITQSSVHYYTGELSKRNGLPVICTGNCSPGGKFVFNRIMRLAKVVSVFAFLPLFPKNLLPFIALTDTGFKSPSAYQEYEAYTEWTNPENVYSSNDVYAVANQSVGTWNMYKGFIFGIPTGATLNGLESTVEAKVSAVGATCFIRIYLIDKDASLRQKPIDPTTTETIFTVGGSDDLWGGNWDVDWLNDYETNFRYIMRGYNTGGTVSVDHIQVKVYYTTVTLPTVTVQAVDQIEKTTARGNGNITDTGGENCDKRGFVYGTTSKADPGNVAPEASGYDQYVEDTGSFGIGAFLKLLIDLLAGTKYYVRSYAHNSAGYDYSNDEVSFNTIFEKTLSIAESSIVSLTKKTFQTLTTTQISIPSLLEIKIFPEILEAIESSIAMLSKIPGKVLTVIATTIPIISLLKTFYRTLSVIESSIASLVKGMLKSLSISVESISVVSLVKSFYRTLATTEISIPNLSKVASYFRSLSVVESSIAGLSKVARFFKSLVATEVSVITVSWVRKIALSAIAISVATISKLKTFYRTLATTMISKVKLFFYGNQYRKQNTAYNDKYSKQGTIYADKYSKRGTQYDDKYF